jgi:hypothetical protein
MMFVAFLQPPVGELVGVETDWIHMESDSDNTFYHIFTRIRIRIRMFSNTNTKRMSRIRKRIWIFTQFGRQYLPIFLKFIITKSCQDQSIST